MASPEVTSALSQLEDPNSPLASKRVEGYNDLLQRIASAQAADQVVPNLQAFVTSVLGESLGIVSARPLLAAAVDAIKQLPSADAKITAGTFALQQLEPRVVSFEEQDADLRYALADTYEAQDDWLASAKVLQGIQLESSQRKIDERAKVQTWIRICRLYLEEDDTVTAESYLKRAKNLIYKLTSPEDAVLKITFDLSQARILDAQCRFLDASSAYHGISFVPTIDEDERMKTLSMAVTCAVLAPAGPQRSRTLAKLYKDERAAQVPEHAILEKMFLDRLLSPAEVDKFAAGLQQHQLARTADGSTVLARAVVEHNLLSASRIYNNIGIHELGTVLGLGQDKAEEYASAMLQQGRLVGRIDQIDGVIVFDGSFAAGGGAAAAAAATGSNGVAVAATTKRTAGQSLRKWDARVQGVAEEVERVASMLQSRHPDFAHAHLVQ